MVVSCALGKAPNHLYRHVGILLATETLARVGAGTDKGGIVETLPVSIRHRGILKSIQYLEEPGFVVAVAQ
jgi:hypothetical protein